MVGWLVGNGDGRRRCDGDRVAAAAVAVDGKGGLCVLFDKPPVPVICTTIATKTIDALVMVFLFRE